MKQVFKWLTIATLLFMALMILFLAVQENTSGKLNIYFPVNTFETIVISKEEKNTTFKIDAQTSKVSINIPDYGPLEINLLMKRDHRTIELRLFHDNWWNFEEVIIRKHATHKTLLSVVHRSNKSLRIDGSLYIDLSKELQEFYQLGWI